MQNIKTTLKSIKWKNYVNYIAVVLVLFFFLIYANTAGLKGSTVVMLEKISIGVILAVSLSLVVGFLGELSLGHAGFMCVGAYLGGKTAVLLEPVFGNSVITFIISLVLGGICAAVCGGIIGLPALRLRGDYLAIVTLAFGEIVKVIFRQSEIFGGNLGLETPRFVRSSCYIICLIMVLITLAVVQNLIHSSHGRAITSIRDNEIAARATGIPVTKYKLYAFIVSAFFAGIAGVLFSFTNNTIHSSEFDYNYSIEILVMVVLGGMGNINGSIISAALITFINTGLQTSLTGNFAVLKDLFYALILIVLVIYNNAPMLKGFREKYNIKNLFNRIFKKRNDPAEIRDDAASWGRIPTKINMDEVLSVDIVKTDEHTSQNGEGGND